MMNKIINVNFNSYLVTSILLPTLEKYHFIVIIENCKVLNDKKENVVANSLMF